MAALSTETPPGVSPDHPSHPPQWGQMPQKSSLPASGKPPKSQGVGQSFLPTQKFRKPFQPGTRLPNLSLASSVCLLLATPASAQEG